MLLTLATHAVVATASGYVWGWDTWVAIGTVALAAGTAVLALQTKRLARATAADVAGQHRPVIATRPSRVSSVEGAHKPCDWTNGSLFVKLHNSGSGPALHVRPKLLPEDSEPDAWDGGAIPSSAEAMVRFRGVAVPTEGDVYYVAVTYLDLADRPYGTTITITCAAVKGEPSGPGTLRVTDTRFGSVPFQDPFSAPELPRAPSEQPAARAPLAEFVKRLIAARRAPPAA